MEHLEMTPTRVRIASALRNAILSGEFHAGEELSITEIAEKLGVSRTPVREAFQTLEAEGLITLRMNKGALVKPIDRNFIVDHFRIRRLLEGEAVYRAAVNKIDTNGLAALQARAQEYGGSIIPEVYRQYNSDLHTAIWKSTGGHKLFTLLESLWNGPSYNKAIGGEEHMVQAIREHENIIAAIADGDADKGREIMHNHIERSMQNILDAL